MSIEMLVLRQKSVYWSGLQQLRANLTGWRCYFFTGLPAGVFGGGGGHGGGGAGGGVRSRDMVEEAQDCV